MKTRLKDKISRWLSVAASIGLAASACADNAAVTVTVDGTSVTASNASAANYDNYTWHKSNYNALKLNIPASSDLVADTYLRLTSLSIGAQNGGSGNYNNQVKYVTVTGVDGFAYKSEVISTTSSGFSSTADTPETSDKQTFSFANPWCFVQVGMDYTVELLDADGNVVAGLSSRCVEYTDSVLSNWNGNQWTPLAELTAEIVTPTTPAAVDEAGDYAIALDGLATYPSISVAGDLTITGSGTLVVTGAFTLGGTLTVDDTVNLAFTTTTDTIQFPVGTAFAGLNIADVSKLYVTGAVTTDGTAFSWAKGTIPAPADNYIKTDTKSTGNTSTRVSRVTTETGYAYIGGWQLYWAGADSAYWNNKANWRYADGTTPTGYPTNIDSPGDHCYFSNEASITACNAQITVAHITLNADVTFIGPTTGAKPLYCCVFDGTGKMRLSNATIGACEKTTGCTINNNVEVVADTTNTLNCKWGNKKVYSFTLNGKLTGSGTLVCDHGAAQNIGAKFYGDNTKFAGTFQTTNFNSRDGTYMNSAISSSSNAVWKVDASHSKSTNNVFPSTDNAYKYFGAYIGTMWLSSGTKVEIGAREDTESTIYPRNHTSYDGYTIRKVGSNVLNLKYADDHNSKTKVASLEITDGTVCCDYNLVPEAISFTGKGGVLKYVAGADSEENPLYRDVSGVITTSSAPVAFDTNGGTYSWATQLSNGLTGGLTKKGAGTLTLTAVPLYSGATRVEAGTLVVPLGTSLGDVYVAEGATLTVDLTGATSSSAFLTCASMENNGTVNWINTPDGITPQTVESDGKYFIAMPRTLTWSGAADDTAWTTAGNWLVGEDVATLAPQPFDSVQFNTATPGVTLTAAAEAFSITASSGLTLATAYDLTVYDDFTVTGAFTKEGKGTLTVEGAFSATEGTTVASGAIDANLETAQNVTLNGGSAYDDCENDTANGYGAKFITPNADLLTLSGAGAVSAEDTLAVTSGSFTGSLTGGMGLSKSGDGTFTLFGNNTFTGDVTVSGGTLKLATPLDLSDVRHDFDSSVATSFSYADEEAGTISVWNDVSGNGGELTVDTDKNAAYATYESTLFSGNGGLTSMAFRMKKTSSFTTLPYTAFFVVQNGSSSQTQNIAGDSEDTRWNIRFRNYGYMKGYGTGGSTIWTSAGIWGNGTLATQGGGSSKDNNGGYNPGANATVLTFVGPMSDNNDWVRGGYSHNEYIGGSSDQNWAEYLTYKRQFSFDEKAAVEQYLMAKWGIGNATYAALPATADVSVAAGATLDLGGQTVTVASLNLSGTIQNGTLVVTSDNITIAATAKVLATIKVSGYDSSMTAPTGFEFSDNNDDTATLVPVYTWTDANGDHAWGTAGNWDKNAVPGENDVVAFPSENAPAGGWTVYVGQGSQTCGTITLYADVTLSLNASQSDWSGINVKGSIEGSGKLILWRSGVNNFAANPVTISCPLVVKANGSDSFLQKVGFNVTGPVEVNSLFVVYDATEFSGAVTLKNGAVVRSSASWYKSGAEAPITFSGSIVIPDGATVSFDRSSQTITGSVTMGAGSTFTLSSATTATAATFTLGDGAKLVVPSGASVTAANITSEAGGDTIVSYTSGTDTVYVNNSVATWVGVSGGSWKDAANWSTGVIPTRYTDVTFPSTFTGTVYVSADSWESWNDDVSLRGTSESATGRDVCKNMIVDGTVTLQKAATLGWCYVSPFGSISGTGTLKLAWTGIDNESGNAETISCALDILSANGSDSYLGGYADTYITGDITVENGGVFKMFRPTAITGELTLKGSTTIQVGDETTPQTVSMANITVASGSQATMTGNTITITGTVTLEGTDSTLTVPSTANVSGATFVCGVNGYKVVGPTANVYSVDVDTNITPGGTSIGYDTEAAATTAAAGYTVVLTKAQETQGLETGYYTTKVEYNNETGKYVVTAELAESVKPTVSEGVTVTTTTVTLPVTNLKKGLYYRVTTKDADDSVTHGSWSPCYDGTNAPTLTSDLPSDGARLYTIEASDSNDD